MAEAIVQDWLSEYETLQSAELKTFAAMHENNQEIADALYIIFNERLKYPDLVHSVCIQFHSFYRSNEETLKRFTLQFIPILIYIYLNSVAMGDKKSCRSVETLLISIYNVEVSTEEGYQKIVSFRMPVLAQPSIYHEEKSLNATDLRRWEENCNRDVKWGPLPQIESLNAQNRMKVMTALLFAYNQQLSLIQKSALFHLCRIASQIVNQGFTKPSGHVHRSSYGNDPLGSAVSAGATTTTTAISSPKPLPRIPLSSQFLVELVHAIYFAMFNEFGTIAIQTLEDIHHRACYEMFTDLILVTNAVRNSLHANPSGQPSDGPMGLSVALTPATNTITVSKSMITNASFRTKKLPDDIPIQGAHDEKNFSGANPAGNTTGSGTAGGGAGGHGSFGAGSGLMSITEEYEQNPNIGSRNTAGRSSKEGVKSHKTLLPGFKKSKDKEAKLLSQSGGNRSNSSSNIIVNTNPGSNNNNNPSGLVATTNDANDTRRSESTITAILKENIAPKPPLRKEKTSISLSSGIVGSTGGGNGGNRNSLQFSTNSSDSSILNSTSGGGGFNEIIPLQSVNLNNGTNNGRIEEKKSDSVDTIDYSDDTTDSLDPSTEKLSTVAESRQRQTLASIDSHIMSQV